MVPKFRAWLKDEKEMQNVLAFDTRGHSFLGIEGTHVTVDGWCDNFEVGKQAVLMQSTGLKDKNGVEIFEGDVIGSQNKDRSNWYVSHHKIVWHDTGFVGKQICSSSFIGLEHWTRGENGYVVIGNIYENPELLEPANEI